MSKSMKLAVEKILKAHNILDAFLAAREYAVKIENAPWMPLCIEKFDTEVSISHYFEQNGDLVPDPDMTFNIMPETGDWLPLGLQLAIGRYYRAAVFEDGQWKVNPRQLREQRSFATMWARNLVAQGFTNGKLVRAAAGG